VAIPAAAKTAELYCEDHFIFEYPVDWYYPSKRTRRNEGPGFMALTSHVIGAQYASYLGLRFVVSGTKRDGRKPEFYEQLTNVVNQVLLIEPVKFMVPVYNMNDIEEKKISEKYNIPLGDTWSCSEYPKCGHCTYCLKRKRAGLDKH